MRRKLLRTLIFIIASLLCVSCGIMPVEEELPAAPVIRSYETDEYQQAVVMRGDMELTKSVKCTYASAKQEKYSFSLGGMYIDKVYVSEGQQVKKGTLLAELEHGNLPERISDKEYELKALELNKSYLPEKQNLELEKQRVIIWGMQRQIEDLMAQSEEYDKEETEEAEVVAAALVNQANDTLIRKIELEKQQDTIVETYEKQMQELEDSLYIARLQLEELKEDLRDRQIYAGIDGTIIHLKTIKDGDRSVKGKSIITIADLDTVVFTVKGEDAQYFPVGTQVTILCEKKELPAQAVEASQFGLKQPEEDDDPMAYLQLLTPDPTLENGVNGTVRITLDQREDVLYVDKKAIKTADGGQFVYMLDDNGLRIRRDVTTGLESGDYIEIVSGLTEGDSVIIE